METVWSTQQSFDKLVNTSVEDKLAALDELGYDGDMINDLDQSEYDQILANANNLRQDDLEDFEYNIAPFIASQVRNGLVLDDKFDLINPQDLITNVGNAEIVTDLDAGGTLYFKEEGRKEFPILGFDEDDEMYINQLDRLGILDTIHNLYPDWKDEDIDVYDIADLIPLNWALLEEVLTRPTTRELMGENMKVNEAVSTKNPKGLAKELEEIKELSDEYGREYFTQMPFTSFDDDPTSVELTYPEFFKVAKAFFEEMDRDQGDPHFTNDELDDAWDQSVDQHTWDTIIKACEKLIERKGKTTQFKDIYKVGYNTLDDSQILADRENQEVEFGESIDEKAIDPALKGQKPKKVDKFEYSMSKDAVKRVADIIYNEMEESDFDLLNDIGFDAYIDKDPEAIKQVKEVFKKYGLPMWALKVFCEAWDDQNESLTEAQSDIAHDHGVHLHYGWKDKYPGTDRDTQYGMSSTAAYVRAVFDNDPSLKSDLPEVVDIWTGAYPDKVYFYINNEDIKSKEDAKAIGQKIVDRFAQKGIDLRHTTSDLHLDSNHPHLLYARVLNVPDEAFKNGAYSGYEVTPIRKYNRKNESLTEGTNDKIYLVTIGYGDDEWDEGEEEFSSKSLDTILDFFNKRLDHEGYHTPTENNLEELANNGEYFDDEDGMYKIKIIDHYEGTNLDNPSDESLTEEVGVKLEGDPDDKYQYRYIVGGRNNFEVIVNSAWDPNEPRTYYVSRWSHEYNNKQEIQDDIKNLQELINVVNELEAKGFKNSELKESLSEGAAEEMAMHGLKEEVANYIYEFYLADVDDNIAHAVHASIPQYDIDWCNEEGNNFIANGVDQMKHALARKIADALFANAPRELGKSKNESLNESFLDKVTLQLDKDGDRAYEVGGSTLENKYDYYQGDVILEDDISQAKLKELGIEPGDKFVVGINDDEDNTIEILGKIEESVDKSQTVDFESDYDYNYFDKSLKKFLRSTGAKKAGYSLRLRGGLYITVVYPNGFEGIFCQRAGQDQVDATVSYIKSTGKVGRKYLDSKENFGFTLDELIRKVKDWMNSEAYKRSDELNESVDEKVDSELKAGKPVRVDKWEYQADPKIVKKAINVLYDKLSEEEFDEFSDKAMGAYIDKDPEAMSYVKKVFNKLNLPMWVLKAYVEAWDDDYNESLTEGVMAYAASEHKEAPLELHLPLNDRCKDRYYGYITIEHPELGEFTISAGINGDIRTDGKPWEYLQEDEYKLTPEQIEYVNKNKRKLSKLMRTGDNDIELSESLTEETGVTKVGDEDNADRWFNSTTYIGGKNNFEISTDAYDSKGQSKSYTASRWSHNYKNVQEVEDDIENLQALKARMLELEDKGFKNSELRESLTEEIWHNRGAGDCQIIERSASGRNALLKRLADGALQPYVIALNMGKDSWGQGKYYTELEDARRDWKRYKFD